MERHVHPACGLNEIRTDYPYRTRYRPESPALAALVQKYGILEPVILTAEKTVVAGHRRVLAARTLGLAEIPARVMTAPAEPRDLFLAAVLSNWERLTGELDQAWVLSRAAALGYQTAELLGMVMPALGLAPQAGLLEDRLKTATLEVSLLDAIAAGRLPFRGARSLAVFSKRDQRVFAERIAGPCALSTSALQQAAEWLLDITRDSGQPLESLFGRPELAIPLAGEGDRKQKGERFFQALKRLRFPRFSAQEAAFQSLAGKVREGDDSVSVESPGAFEQEGLTLKATLRDRAALERLIAALGSKRKVFNDLFDLML